MKIAVLGTGMVGRAHASKLAGLGHEVLMGTRNVAESLAKTEKDGMGNSPLSEWHTANEQVKIVSLAEAAEGGEIVINVLSGAIAVMALEQLAAEIGEKVVMDISNPLDFSRGFPPTLTVCNTDSLGEQIQAALPKAKVVKTLNTVNASLQVDPKSLASGDHQIFVSGNDADAKAEVTRLLKEWYGWESCLDLGEMSTARGTEMWLPLWLRIMGALNTSQFNLKIVR